MSRAPVTDQVQVNFRMPVDLRERIKLAAEENNRSMNAEIIATLEEAYPDPYDKDAAVLALIEQVAATQREMQFCLKNIEIATDRKEVGELGRHYTKLFKLQQERMETLRDLVRSET